MSEHALITVLVAVICFLSGIVAIPVKKEVVWLVQLSKQRRRQRRAARRYASASAERMREALR